MKCLPQCIFTAEFKREVIKLVADQGLALDEASSKLDANLQSVKTWITQ